MHVQGPMHIWNVPAKQRQRKVHGLHLWHMNTVSLWMKYWLHFVVTKSKSSTKTRTQKSPTLPEFDDEPKAAFINSPSVRISFSKYNNSSQIKAMLVHLVQQTQAPLYFHICLTGLFLL